MFEKVERLLQKIKQGKLLFRKLAQSNPLFEEPAARLKNYNGLMTSRPLAAERCFVGLQSSRLHWVLATTMLSLVLAGCGDASAPAKKGPSSSLKPSAKFGAPKEVAGGPPFRGAVANESDEKAFEIPPYLQMGEDDGTNTDSASVTVCFAPASRGETKSDKWEVKWRAGGENDVPGKPLKALRLKSAPSGLQRWVLSGLPADGRYIYEIYKGSRLVFRQVSENHRSRSGPIKIAVLGDSGRGLPGQKRVARELYRSSPEFLIHVGDIVYPNGRESEYRKFHFPVYNGNLKNGGFPILRRVVSVGAPGNHDTAYRNLDRYPDGLAYYYLWQHPTGLKAVDASTVNKVKAGLANNPGNFTFAAGPVFGVVLDSNTYVSWDSTAARTWLDDALSKGESYPWRVVVFHHPPFHSSDKKKDEVYMSTILPILSKHKVALVLNGHVHNYQSTYPISWDESAQKMKIERNWAILGKRNAAGPQVGTVFVVTGAGGAELYDQKLAGNRGKWKPFTRTYIPGYSFSMLEVDSKKLGFKQIADNGRILDSFTIERD